MSLSILLEKIENSEVHQVTVCDNEIYQLENTINTFVDMAKTIRRASDNAALSCL